MRDAVDPAIAGMIEQRHLRQVLGDELLQRRRRDEVDAVLGIHTIDRILRIEAVAETGRVAEHVVDRRLAARRLESHTLAVHAGEHLHVLERRDVLVERIAQLELAFLVQHQQRHARHGLGHRVEAEQAVRAHRGVGFALGHAERFQVRDATAARDQRDDAGFAAGIDLGLHRRVEASEALGRQADVGGPRHRQLVGPSGAQDASQQNGTCERHQTRARARRDRRHELPLRGRPCTGLWPHPSPGPTVAATLSIKGFA